MLAKLKPYALTILAALALAYYVFFAVKGSGISVVALLVVLVFAIVAFAVLKGPGSSEPGASSRRTGHLLILLPAVLGSCVAQNRLESQARSDADAIVKALHAYQAQRGGAGCPKELSEIGFDQRALRDRWYMSYLCEEGKPRLFYSSPAVLLAAWHYDFEKRDWVSLN